MPNIPIDKYLHRFLRALKEVNDQYCITDPAKILGGIQRVSEIFPKSSQYPNQNFSMDKINKIYEAYLKPFGYESWGDFSQKELAIKKVLDLQKNSFEDLIINMRVESLTSQYYLKAFSKNTITNLELAEKLYKASFVDEPLYEYDNAILKMEYAIRLFPENPIYFLRIAELFHQKGDVLQCMEYLGNITTNSYDTTFPIVIRHNIALALRSLGFKEANIIKRKQILITVKNELEDIYQNGIGLYSILKSCDLKFKIGINLCYSLLDNQEYISVGQLYGDLLTLSKSVVQMSDELSLRLDMILCILESRKNLELGNQLFEKLYLSFTQNKNINENYEFLSEITSCWASYYKHDHNKQIEILEMSFRNEIWGERSDIEYKNMLRLADFYEIKRDYVSAMKYFKEVLRWSYLNAELRDSVNRKIQFCMQRINQ